MRADEMFEGAREYIVPIMSASVSWLTLAITGSCFPSLPKFANNRRACASRFSLELNSWSIRSSSTRTVRAKICAVNSSENFGSARSIRTMVVLSTRVTTESSKALAVETRRGRPVRQPSPMRNATIASLPCSEMTVILTLPSRM
jgi:hypothetical protein